MEGYYRKIIEEGTFKHRFYKALGFPPISDEGTEEPLVLRITLGDMALLDGFYISLPADAGSLSIEDAIRRYVLCESEEDRIQVRRKLSRDPNPDLLDIYDELLYLYEQAETGKVTLSYHINNGASDIQPTDPVSLHQRLCTTVSTLEKRKQPPCPSFGEGERPSYSPFENEQPSYSPFEKGQPSCSPFENEQPSYSPFEKGAGGISADGDLAMSYRLLDLVLEVCDNLDPFSGLTDQQKDAMLRDFRGIFILYLMDKFGYQPGPVGARHASPLQGSHQPGFVGARHASPLQGGPDSEHLSTVLEYLASEDVGLLTLIEGECSITPKGHDLLSSIIDEAEFYIDNYDIFGDVYVKGVSEIRFNTGYGGNLVVPVFIRSGVDPYRALFIVALYLGNMDELDLAILSSEDPFKELFSLIAHSPTEEDIGTELLDRIVHEGSLKVEERRLREARLKHIESIERRIDDFGF